MLLSRDIKFWNFYLCKVSCFPQNFLSDDVFFLYLFNLSAIKFALCIETRGYIGYRTCKYFCFNFLIRYRIFKV